MRVVFFGTPSFAVRPLEALYNSKHDVVAVVSQPDRAKDRKGVLLPTEAKAAAQRLGIPVLQFDSVKKEGVAALKALDADIFVTAAYGQILSREILDIPRHGVINVHASLLPKYRGSSPVQWAIINGERETGVTIMQTAEGLDTGDMLMASGMAIEPSDTTETMLCKLAESGAELLLKTLGRIEDGTITRTPQDEKLATKCPLITKEMGALDFSDSAQSLVNKIRAISCYCYINGEYTKILDACAGSGAGDLTVDCGKDKLNILRLQPQGKKPMTAKEFLAGHRGAINIQSGNKN